MLALEPVKVLRDVVVGVVGAGALNVGVSPLSRVGARSTETMTVSRPIGSEGKPLRKTSVALTTEVSPPT